MRLRLHGKTEFPLLAHNHESPHLCVYEFAVFHSRKTIVILGNIVKGGSTRSLAKKDSENLLSVSMV
jgi:hypothetical protein